MKNNCIILVLVSLCGFFFAEAQTEITKEQTFRVYDVKTESYKGGLDNEYHTTFVYNIELKYGPEQVDVKKYPLYFEVLNQYGEVLYNSDGSFFTKNDEIYLSSNLSNKSGFHYYQRQSIPIERLGLTGVHQLDWVLFTEVNGQLKQIYKHRFTVNVPVTHSFEDQKFTINRLAATAGQKEGIQGVRVRFNCKFAYQEIRALNTDGDYFFFVRLTSNYADIYSPTGSSLSQEEDKVFYIVEEDDLANAVPNKTFMGDLFIPYYLMQATPGSHKVELSLHVTDKNNEVYFPTLGNYSLSIQKPQTTTIQLEVTKLEVEKKSYDTFIFSNSAPDLQWRVIAGENCLYKSYKLENSYEGPEDETTFTVSKGDKIRLLILDGDKFINPNDVLADFPLYFSQPKTVTNQQKDDVTAISYQIRVLE